MYLIMGFRDPNTEPIKKVSIIISKGSLEGIYPGPVSYTHLTLPTNREV